MKNTYLYKSIIIAALFLFGFSSCSKFLEEESISTTTAESLSKTKAGAESLVNSCYYPARLWYGKMIGYLLTEGGTDEILMGAWGTGYSAYHQYTTELQGAQEGLYHVWKFLYGGVNACNTVINRINDSELDDATKITRLGEVHFLRAFYYYHLVETFGAVPLELEETITTKYTLTRNSVDEVYAQIFADLNIALANLAGVTDKQGGRVTEPTVKAFLARLYLTREMNSEALAMSKDVIDNYGFSLNGDPTTMWLMDNSDANTNNEAIWFINYCDDNVLNGYPRNEPYGYFYLWEGGHNAHAFFCIMNFGLDGFTWDIENGRPLVQYMPSKYLLNLFDETIDARYEGSFRTVWWANDTTALPAGIELGDTILVCTKDAVTEEYRASKNYTIYDINDVYNEDGSVKYNSRYVQINKFADPTRSDRAVHYSKRDAIVFRLPEMYLIAAEASMKLGDNGSAAGYINVVRERAAYEGKEAEMDITAADVSMDFILDERAREFVGEQLRWFDLKRTETLIDRLNLYNPDAAKNIKTYHLLRPIPQTELDVVQNEDFSQNPGYN